MASKQIGQKLKSEIEVAETPFTFGIKFKIKERSNRNYDFIRLECTVDNHNKYYEIQYFAPNALFNGELRDCVIIKYGKIGNQPSQAAHYFGSEADARKFFNKKRGEKIKKEYKEVSTIAPNSKTKK